MEFFETTIIVKNAILNVNTKSIQTQQINLRKI